MTEKTFKIRPYQQKILDNFLKWSKAENKLATIILPTGAGKTYTASLCITSIYKEKVLWVAHREELIDQAYDTLSVAIPDAHVEKEMAEYKANPNSDIIVGSIQTLSRKRKHMNGFDPKYIFIDEYHHRSEENTYQKLIDSYPTAKVIGLTATPYRFSGQKLDLGQVLFQMDIGTAVSHGYLVPPEPEILKSNVTLADVATRSGDFVTAELSKVVNVDSRNKRICERIIELVKDQKRQGILFAVDIAHSHSMYEMLKNEIRCAEVYGHTPKDERRYLMDKVRNQEIDVLTNMSCAIEGFDAPHMSFVAMARPTRSLGLFTQCIGRGLRTFPGKTNCIVLDVYDKIKIKQRRVTFVDMAVEGDIYNERKRAASILERSATGGTGNSKTPKLELEASKLENFPVFVIKKNDDRWTIDEDTFDITSWSIAQDQWIVCWTEEQTINKIEVINDVRQYTGELEKVKKERLFYLCFPSGIEKGRLIECTRNRYDLTVVKDERLSRFEANLHLSSAAVSGGVFHLVRADAKWKRAPISEKQRDFVASCIQSKRIGFDLDLDSLTKGDASAIIEQLKWQEIIKKKFGTTRRDLLIGHDQSVEEV